MRIPHPIPYQGSKRALARAIISYFPQDVNRLIEPFAGSAAVSLAAICYNKTRRIILNDLNTPLIRLWDEIIHRPHQIAREYANLWRRQDGKEREFYDHVRARFNQTQRPDCFLYLLARCVKASVRYNASGQFNQGPDNRRKGAHPETMRENILGASELLKGKTRLRSTDYREILEESNSNDIVYMDPPYQGVCGNRDPRYFSSLPLENFVDALQALNKRNIPYIVSYDGRTGAKQHGRRLPLHLELAHLEIAVGRSTQATLLGREAITFESLYFSPALMGRIERFDFQTTIKQPQPSLFEVAL